MKTSEMKHVLNVLQMRNTILYVYLLRQFADVIRKYDLNCYQKDYHRKTTASGFSVRIQDGAQTTQGIVPILLMETGAAYQVM
jgi:hypothetical protein